MSRTIRRKNAWNKEKFVACDNEWLDHMSGVNPFPYIQFSRRKYNGCTNDQIRKRMSAKFHSDSMCYREDNRGIKGWSRWWLRNNLNQELRIALINGEEDNLYIDETATKKKMNGWWLWWD